MGGKGLSDSLQAPGVSQWGGRSGWGLPWNCCDSAELRGHWESQQWEGSEAPASRGGCPHSHPGAPWLQAEAAPPGSPSPHRVTCVSCQV